MNQTNTLNKVIEGIVNNREKFTLCYIPYNGGSHVRYSATIENYDYEVDSINYDRFYITVHEKGKHEVVFGASDRFRMDDSEYPRFKHDANDSCWKRKGSHYIREGEGGGKIKNLYDLLYEPHKKQRCEAEAWALKEREEKENRFLNDILGNGREGYGQCVPEGKKENHFLQDIHGNNQEKYERREQENKKKVNQFFTVILGNEMRVQKWKEKVKKFLDVILGRYQGR